MEQEVRERLQQISNPAGKTVAADGVVRTEFYIPSMMYPKLVREVAGMVRQARIETLETCAKERCAACRNGLAVLYLDTPYPTHKNASGEVFDCRAVFEQRMLAELRKEAGE